VLTYQWQYSPDGAAWNNITDSVTPGSQNTPTLVFVGTRVAINGYKLRCVVKNGGGTATSDPVTLNVNPTPPAITQQPVNATVVSWQNAVFSCAVTGDPAPTYRWQFYPNKGSAWVDITSAASEFSGQATAKLSITGATVAISGYKMRCIVTNSLGTVTTEAATLTVTPNKPIVLAHPANTSINAGQPTTFTGNIASDPAPTYQWQFSTNNGSTWGNVPVASPYSGQTTKTLTISPASLAMDGYRYRLAATNAAGSLTTNPAMLNVIPNPTGSLFANFYYWTAQKDSKYISGWKATTHLGITGIVSVKNTSKFAITLSQEEAPGQYLKWIKLQPNESTTHFNGLTGTIYWHIDGSSAGDPPSIQVGYYK